MSEKLSIEEFSGRRVTEVKMFSFAKAAGDRVLRTEGIDNGIALAAYDQRRQVGYLAHLVSPKFRPNQLETPLQRMRFEVVSEGARWHIWLRGGVHTMEGAYELPNVNRNYVHDALRNLSGITHVDAHWNSNPEQALTVILDCANGQLTTLSEDYDGRYPANGN
jgi:chemotaxis receptor (MCP) glutamine deamidase CheD